jgi:hypothetical protein
MSKYRMKNANIWDWKKQDYKVEYEDHASVFDTREIIHYVFVISNQSTQGCTIISYESFRKQWLKINQSTESDFLSWQFAFTHIPDSSAVYGKSKVIPALEHSL